MSQYPALQRSSDIDFALMAGIQVTLSEIDVEEFRTLKLLRLGRDRYNAEQNKNQPKQRP